MTIYNTQSNTKQYDSDINKWYFAGLVKYLDSPHLLHRKVGTTVNSKSNKWRAAVDALVGRPSEVAEGTEEAPLLRPRQVTEMKLGVKLVKAALVFTEEYIEDDGGSGTARMQNYIQSMAQRFVLQLELDWTDKFINTGATLDALRDQRDGVALFSLVHPAGDTGLTYANTVGVGRAPSEAVLSSLIAHFMSNLIDDSGELIPQTVANITIVCHPSKYAQWLQLTKSTASTADYKNNGVLNIPQATGVTFTVIAAPYQTSTTRWTAFCDIGEMDDSGLITVMRVAPSAPKKEVTLNPGRTTYVGRMRYGHIVTDPRCVFSDPGQ